jgi:radical SAM protein with 4Fe4S-binding SPASM domain
MKRAGVQHVGVSLDGDQATHDRIRRHPGSFRRIMELFALGRKHDFKVHVVTSINKVNFPVRERILRLMLEQGVKLWQVQVVNSFGRAGVLRDQLLLDPRQYVRLCDDIRLWQKACGKRIRIAAADSIGYCHPVTDAILGDCEWRGCNAGMHVLGVQADGSVLGCLSLQAPEFVAGNVRRRRLSAIWNDDSRFAYTRGHDASRLEGACAACAAAKQCKAGCLGMAYSVDGSIHRNSTCYRAITAKKPARA